MEVKEFTIKGVITTPGGVDEDQLMLEFITWIESKGYYFGGGIGPYQEDEK